MIQLFTYIFLIFLLVGGFILIINSFKITSCPPPIIEYRYVPRSFIEEQKNPVKVTDIFGNMFTETSINPT